MISCSENGLFRPKLTINMKRVVLFLVFLVSGTSAWASVHPDGLNFIIPAGCENKQPANVTWGRVDLWNGEVVQVDAARFELIFDQFWPATETVERQIVVRRSEYAALRLVASSAGDFGLLTFSTGAIASPSRTVSISECPGQFEDLPSNCARTFDSGFLSWQVGGESTDHCVLNPGTIYYFNIINGSPSDLSVPLCPVAACTNLVRIQGGGGTVVQSVPAGSAWLWALLTVLIAFFTIRHYRA